MQIKCIDCGEGFGNDELVFDGDELKEVSEKYPDWGYARCTPCEDDMKEVDFEAIFQPDGDQYMKDRGYVYDVKHNTWIKRRS